MSYNRWTSADPNTIAYRIFKKHHCEINDYLWSYIPLESFGNYIVRHEKEKNIHDIFFVAGPDAKRVYEDKNKWRQDISSFSKWTWKNSLIATLSYFEFYTRRICLTALMSDPGLIIGAPRATDGVLHLKNNSAPEIERYILGITKGTWVDRAKNFESLFGWLPLSISENIGVLDKMRIIRNRTAHAFGRDLDDIFLEKGNDKPIDSLRIEKLKEFMSIVDLITKEMDNYLLSNHIGEFESIYIYHKSRGSFHGFTNEKAKQFKKILNSSHVGNPRDLNFCFDLITDYENMKNIPRSNWPA